MHKYQKISLACTVLCAAAMLGFFVVQASVEIQNHYRVLTLHYGTIAFGYPQGVPGCQGGAPNGTVVTGENCDDGNLNTGDGCANNCTVEAGWSCTGSPSVCAPVCGDGLVTGSEPCDPGPSGSMMCNSDCTLSSCGDGKTNAVAGETCDDGVSNSASGACDLSCHKTYCGDNILETPNGDGQTEQCDPGNSGPTMSCNSDCTLSSCGDVKVNPAAGETCDNGVGNSTTGTCDPSCKKTFCGDGIIETPNGNSQNEQCEPTLDPTCTSSCTIGVGLGTAAYVSVVSSPVITSSGATRLPPPATCGNGRIDTNLGEQCDDGRYNGLTPHCDRWCRTQYCGDGVVEKASGEECEPVRAADGSLNVAMCGKTCTVPSCYSNGTCFGGCRWQFLPACAVISPNTGLLPYTPVSNVLPSPQSSSQSTIPFEFAQSSSSAFSDVSTLLSGSQQFTDGVVSSESSATSSVSDSSSSVTAAQIGMNPSPVCGDGIVEPDEECDLGTAENTLGHGCTPTCKKSSCGNGMLEPGEECDDGPRNSNTKSDSCSTLCLLPRCGDGIVDPSFGEVCDNGLKNSDTLPDACRMNCVPAFCGDRIVDSGEQCDDGPSGSVTCTPTCTLKILVDPPPHSAAPSSAILSPLMLFLNFIGSIGTWRVFQIFHF